MSSLEIHGMNFEWYSADAEESHKNRNIKFDEICSVFTDRKAVSINDIGYNAEGRQLITGLSSDNRLLTVVWFESEDTATIVMAFEPRDDQRRRYHNEY